ncbi:MAG: hypothetical protein V3V09_04150 [Arenicellales bacterium]
MGAGNNFVDLRITNAGIGSAGEDSVWPAFTDIMTVILMIFLISLVAFLIRNTQLVDELQTTLIEKDQISELALLNAEKNTSLQGQLALVRERILSLENTLQGVGKEKDKLTLVLEQREKIARDLETEIALLSKLRDQLNNDNSDLLSQLDLSQKSLLQTETDFSESKNTLNEKISLLLATKAGLILAKEKNTAALSEAETDKLKLNQQIISLTEQLRFINEKLDANAVENKSLNTQLEDKNVIMVGLSSSKEELEQKLLQMAGDLSKLQNLYASRGDEVTALQAQANASTTQFKSLQEEFDSLDEQYRKLIRPARSSAGKHVVDVYYAKVNGQDQYRIKQPHQETPQVLGLSALHKTLSTLKSTRKQTLYTKVRIDDKSGIGFNEAWQFTQSILSKYDYYHNDYSEAQ